MRILFKFIIPLWFGMIVNTLLGITDFYFLKKISLDYLAVIGVSYIPFSLISTITVGVGIACNREIASSKKLDYKKILIYLVFISIILISISKYFKEYIFFFAKDNILYDEILAYFDILSYLILPTSIFYFCTGILRGHGRPKESIKFNILVVILNFLLDYLFIKLNILDNPLIGCAYASFISDFFVSIIYIVYLHKKSYLKLEKDILDTKEFFKTSFSFSLEKIFSVSTITIITSIYISKLDKNSLAIYYGIDRFFMPIVMFVYCYFEWVIYAISKKLKLYNKNIYLYYFLLLSVFGILISKYLNLNYIKNIYLILFVFYNFIFILERELVSKLFVLKRASLVNKVIFIKNIIMLICFDLFFRIDNLNLISIIIIKLSLIILEYLILLYFKKRYQIFFKTLIISFIAINFCSSLR
ncbi:polysaccharide biosynthesis C-terminal domain-containing protein [Peptostreptococcaceae bacterium AGR-M142]